VSDFLTYLNTEGVSNAQKLADNASAITDEMLQAIKNKSAPIIGGSSGAVGGGGGGFSSYTGPINIPKGGGKVLPTGGRISQGWGKSNIHYGAGRHTGMDFAGASGSRINSAANGVVIRSGWDGAYGNSIRVRQADGTTALYGHMSGLNVKAGQQVRAGQQIGRMGSTGRATGTHLHFEIRRTDKYGGDINPRGWYGSR
jgi:murein DD-endopeptidase MepM/ murein hydrolase activator NlpD